MTDTTGAKKTNKWLWPLLAALVLVGVLAWAFNRGADDGNLSEKMASDPLSRETTNDNPAPPNTPVSSMVPDNANGNASVITEADAARTGAAAGQAQNAAAARNAAGGGAVAAGAGAGASAPAAMPAPEGRAMPGADGRASPAPAAPR